MLATSGSSHLILEGLNDLVKLVGTLDGDRVRLVFILIENCDIVVTCLVLVANLRRVAFCLVLNTFVVRLEDAADALLRGFLRLEDVERHFLKSLTRWKDVRETCQNGLCNVRIELRVF